MALEEWVDNPQSGDVLSREVLLDEIKQNIIDVLNDYKGLGIENENQLIQQANTLFTGDIIPSRDDWNILILVLKELSTIKETGVMYDDFIADVSDSLGVSDLKQIQSFLDYIQGLPPLMPEVSIQLARPEWYKVVNPRMSTTDEWDHATLQWDGVSSNYLKKPMGTIQVTPSLSEDIAEYELILTAGMFTQTVIMTPQELKTTTIELDWLNWFPTNQLNNVYLQAEIIARDKRGNESSVVRKAAYPAEVIIPQGVELYRIEYFRDNTGYMFIGETKNLSYYWDVPRINGTYQFKVRAWDKSGYWTEWVFAPSKYIRFIPDPPGKPNPKISLGTREATVTWAAVPRAEYYEIWHGGEGWATDNTDSNNTYWKRIKATDERKVVLGKYNEGKWYTWYVRAINEGGENVGYTSGTMKKRVLKTRTYNQVRPRVWRTAYDRIWKSRSRTSYGAAWRSTNNLYQGEWVDADWGGNRWFLRGGGSYWAYGGQQWGNHMSFIFFDYGDMRDHLRGKEIQSVTIGLQRASGSAALNAHGHKQATPLYLYNHNRDDNNSTTVSNAFTLFRHDGKVVNKSIQQSVGSGIFDRGEWENFTNSKTKKLVQNIVDGKMRGLGIVKYYGNYLGSHGPVADKAYMILKSNVKITVKYYEIQ